MRRTCDPAGRRIGAAALSLRRAGARAAWERPDEPTLEARAILPADASAPAPFAGAPDTDPRPARAAPASPSAGSAR